MTGAAGGSAEVVVNTASFTHADDALLRRAAEHVLAHAGAVSGEISITLLDDEAIADLNHRYLGRDGPTDVIAFSLGDDGGPVMGDVYIGAEQARRQASRLEVDESEELARLAVHGVLHVLGHDHPEGPERLESPMFALQERLVSEVLAAP